MGFMASELASLFFQAQSIKLLSTASRSARQMIDAGGAVVLAPGQGIAMKIFFIILLLLSAGCIAAP